MESLEALRHWQAAIPGPAAFWYAVTALGAGLFYFLFAYFLALARGSSALGFALALGWAAVKVLKTALAVPRPFALDPAVAYPQAVAGAGGASLPSGHAALAALFSFFLARGGPPWGYLLAALWTLLVSLSRVELGVHYPADVIAGAGLGLLLAFALPKTPPNPALYPPSLALGVTFPLLAAPAGLAAAFPLLRRPLGALRAAAATGLLLLTLPLLPREGPEAALSAFAAPLAAALVVGWSRWKRSPTSTT